MKLEGASQRAVVGRYLHVLQVHYYTGSHDARGLTVSLGNEKKQLNGPNGNGIDI